MSEIAMRQDNLPSLPTIHEVNTDPTGGRLVKWAQAAQAANQLARSLVYTDFVPAVYRARSESDAGAAAGNATAVILMGDELGLSPLAALRGIYIFKGTPALYARTMRALALSHGHRMWNEKSTDDEVVVCGQRRGSDKIERVSWTFARAKKAGYTGNTKYTSDPQAMLQAKADSEVARKIAADVLAGVPHSVEDLELEPVEGTVPTAAPTTTRVTRRKPEPAPIPEPDLTPEDVQPDEPVEAELVEPDAKMISPAQLKNVHRLLGKLGVGTDREAGLAYLKEAVGVDVASSKDLTLQQARQTIDFLMDLAGESDGES